MGNALYGNWRTAMLIRDTIHLDIELNRFEEKILRTKEMQRLQWVRQLGSTYMVYPCAVHTRFSHSLGVFHMSKVIMKSIESNGYRIPPEEQKLIRIMALVHDIAHLSFGHTLETELQLVEDHDQGDRIVEFLTTGQLGQVLGENGERIAKMIQSDPIHPDNDIKPYQIEIVKDTICADILDYIIRDSYFTGIKRSYDTRFFRYFTIADYANKPHLVIKITEEGAFCKDVLVELEHLLRIRYTLGERVYNYHTKIAADAMLGKAVSEANLTESFFYDKGDEQTIMYLANGDHGSEIAKKLGQAYLSRKTLSRCYMLDQDSLGRRLTHFVSRYHRDGEVRNLCKNVESEIIQKCAANGITLDESEFIIFCHEPEMNLKAANLLVMEDDKEPERLSKVVDAIKQIHQDHRDLWRFYAFTRKDKAIEVGRICEEYFGYPNRCIPQQPVLV